MKLTQIARKLINTIDPPKLATGDGYLNLLANIGNTGTNAASAGQYLNNYVTREPQILRTMYRTSFIIRRVCDSRADDMTKAGMRIDSDLPPDKIEDIQSELHNKQMWQQLADTIRWATLFGTAFIMPVLDGHDVEKPLKIDAIGKGQLTGFQVFDRWQLVPAWQDGRILKLGRDNGYPIAYLTIANGMGIPALKIHHSRLFRIDATPLPWWDRYTENFYSASVVEAILDRVKAFDQSSMAAVALIEAARNDVLYTDSLPEMAGQNAGLYQRLSAKFQQIAQFRTNQGLTVLPTDEKLERFSTAMTGVSEIIDRMGEQVSGATGIPLCRLLGKSSGGLNGGDNDLLAAYYEDVNAQQENQIKSIVEPFSLITALSLGILTDIKDLKISFYPLNKLSAIEKVQVASQGTDTIIKAFEASLLTQQVAMKELKQLTEETGYFSNLQESDIEAADDEPPMLEQDIPMQPETIGDASSIPQGSSWITLEDGQHVLIGKNGQVIAGAGGALNGKYYSTHGNVEKRQFNYGDVYKDSDNNLVTMHGGNSELGSQRVATHHVDTGIFSGYHNKNELLPYKLKEDYEGNISEPITYQDLEQNKKNELYKNEAEKQKAKRDKVHQKKMDAIRAMNAEIKRKSEEFNKTSNNLTKQENTSTISSQSKSTGQTGEPKMTDEEKAVMYKNKTILISGNSKILNDKEVLNLQHLINKTEDIHGKNIVAREIKKREFVKKNQKELPKLTGSSEKQIAFGNDKREDFISKVQTIEFSISNGEDKKLVDESIDKEDKEFTEKGITELKNYLEISKENLKNNSSKYWIESKFFAGSSSMKFVEEQLNK